MACGECLLHTASEVEVFGDEADDGTGSVDDDMNPTLWIPRPDAIATLIKGRGSLHAISRVLESARSTHSSLVERTKSLRHHLSRLEKYGGVWSSLAAVE
jgi:hypothetical protein